MSSTSSTLMPAAVGHRRIVLAQDLALSHVAAHRGQAAQHVADHAAVAGGEQVREVVDRDAHRVDRGEHSSGSAS